MHTKLGVEGENFCLENRFHSIVVGTDCVQAKASSGSASITKAARGTALRIIYIFGKICEKNKEKNLEQIISSSLPMPYFCSADL